MKYASLPLLVVIGLMLWLGSCNLLLAQALPQSSTAPCGTLDITLAQAKELKQQMMVALRRKMAARKAFATVTYIPIRPHIIRQSDGTEGFDLASLNYVMATTNRQFLLNGSGIQFYFAGVTPNYINNDGWFSNFPYSTYDPAIETYFIPNALNQFYTNRIELPTIAGYAAYPANNLSSTLSVISTFSQNIQSLANELMPHELGHTFGLFHTFGQGSGRTDELVTRGIGANCKTAGDAICDTPADPYIVPSGYDPNYPAHDANGDVYMPSYTNIMSYYHGALNPDFTLGQYDRMQAGLALRQTHTAYTLDFPASPVTPISNLAATSNGVAVVLTWQDNADNEMGYFIERSTSPTTNFIPIGGVAPNVVTFLDNQTTPLTQYYYRIRPSNTTTGSIGSTASIVTPAVPPVTGLTTTDITGNSARLNWTSLGEGARYQVQWRIVGAANWTIINDIAEPSIWLSLIGNTTYEWEVRAIGNETYSGPVNFQTPCSIPTRLTSNPARVTAALSWNGTENELYSIQWRPIGTTTWNTVAGLTGITTNFGITGSYSLTGLTSQTPYEWQVQGVCPGSPTVSSDYTAPQSFTTGVCNPPYASINNLGAESASVYLSPSTGEPGISSEIRYRPVGSPDWITISGIPNVLYESSNYTLTGLTNNTTYEWQLKNVCGAVESSAYTYLSTFPTTCRVPTGLSNTTTSTGAILQWTVNAAPDPSTSFTLQYRPVGSPTWTTITSLTTATSPGITIFPYSLTGLTSGTTYEWHVLTNCTANVQSSYSVTKTFTTGCNQLVSNNLKSLLITSTSAQLVWTAVNDPGVQYYISYRAAGAANWTEINGLSASSTGGFYNLTGLTNNTTYEWRIAPLCPDQPGSYIDGPTFTTQCPTPIDLFALPRFSTALLNWKQMGLAVTYDVNYRPVGQADWNTVSNITSTTLLVTGLSNTTQYEWQVRTHCTDGQLGEFSLNQAYFTTNSCSMPNASYPSASNITTTSATISWSYSFSDADTPVDVRYRIVGSPTWTTRLNLPSTNFSGTVSLTSLTPNSTYEWQVKALCSPSISSEFNGSSTFHTLPICMGMYTIQTGAWNDPAIWSCSRVPINTDVVQIKHIVIIPASYTAKAQQVGFDPGQKLSFGTNAQLKLGL